MTGVRRFAQWGLWFGGALVLLAAVLIGIDVLMRKFLARSIGGADELPAIRWPSEPPGASARRCSIARISASIRSTCCSRRSCAWRSISLALVLLVGFFALTLWHGWASSRSPGRRARAASRL